MKSRRRKVIPGLAFNNGKSTAVHSAKEWSAPSRHVRNWPSWPIDRRAEVDGSGPCRHLCSAISMTSFETGIMNVLERCSQFRVAEPRDARRAVRAQCPIPGRNPSRRSRNWPTGLGVAAHFAPTFDGAHYGQATDLARACRASAGIAVATSEVMRTSRRIMPIGFRSAVGPVSIGGHFSCVTDGLDRGLMVNSRWDSSLCKRDG